MTQHEFDFASGASEYQVGSNNQKSQEEIVFDIVKKYCPIRTEQVKILAMQKGCSCSDRFLRWLREKGKITRYKIKGDKTLTWNII